MFQIYIAMFMYMVQIAVAIYVPRMLKAETTKDQEASSAKDWLLIYGQCHKVRVKFQHQSMQ